MLLKKKTHQVMHFSDAPGSGVEDAQHKSDVGVVKLLPKPIHTITPLQQQRQEFVCTRQQIVTEGSQTILAQLRTNKSPILHKYLHKITPETHTTPNCPLCHSQTHDTKHIGLPKGANRPGPGSILEGGGGGAGRTSWGGEEGGGAMSNPPKLHVFTVFEDGTTIFNHNMIYIYIYI